jgi:hypothetical protein
MMRKSLFAAVLLFAGSALVSAVDADVNGQFKRYSKNFAPADWGLNMSRAQAQSIKLTVQPSTDPAKSNVLVIDTTKSSYGAPLRHTKGFACKAGDKLILSADVTAIGSISFDFTKYGRKGFLRSQKKGYRLLGKKVLVKFELLLNEDNPPKELYKVHMVMHFPKGKVSKVENLKVDLIPAADAAK